MNLDVLYTKLNELSPYLKKAQKWPWYNIFWVVVSSFILASIVCVTIAYLLIPSGIKIENPQLIQVTSYLGNNEVLKKEIISNQDLQIIYSRNIFNSEGKFGDLALSENQSSQTITKTDLPLRLLGIIYGGNPYLGIATIENKEKSKVNSFVVGDMLMDNVELIEIHKDKVILNRGGKKEYLELEIPSITTLQSKRQRMSSRMPTVRKDLQIGSTQFNAVSSIPEVYKEEGFERTKTDIVMSRSYKEQLLGPEFTQVLQDAKATPNIVDGKVKGFVLTRIREGSIYHKAGLQDNDIVEEVNGTPLNDVAGSIKLLQSLRNESNFEILVRRGNSTFTIKIKVQ